MNLYTDGSDVVSPEHWESPEMRQALGRRDLKTVYELLGRVGVSQRRIARLTGQSPSEVYTILARGRQVMAHDVLVRIADGLGVPRGYMGLAYDAETKDLLDLAVASFSTVADERSATRDQLTHAATTTMGVAPDDVGRWWQPVDQAVAPAPERIGMSDVAQVEALTSAMWRVDDAHGGGACRDAVAAQVRWAQQLLRASMDDSVRRRLFLALADLHVLAGWASFDVGMRQPAQAHLARALELSRAGQDWAMTAHVLFRIARVHLHNKAADQGLRFLQLGQIAAQNSGCGVTTAMIYVNEAWAHADLGDRAQMERSLGRAAFEFEAAEHDVAPHWVWWFDAGELHAMAGTARAALPGADTAILERAQADLELSFAERGDQHGLAQALALPILSGTAARLGDTDTALTLAVQAIDASKNLSSVRVADRLVPLASTLSSLDHTDIPEVVDRIGALRGTR